MSCNDMILLVTGSMKGTAADLSCCSDHVGNQAVKSNLLKLRLNLSHRRPTCGTESSATLVFTSCPNVMRHMLVFGTGQDESDGSSRCPVQAQSCTVLTLSRACAAQLDDNWVCHHP